MEKKNLSRIGGISEVTATPQKALPLGESPEPAPVKYIETPPPGWVQRTVAMSDGSTVVHWHRGSVQATSLREAWDMAILDAHDTLCAVAGRYVIAGDEATTE